MNRNQSVYDGVNSHGSFARVNPVLRLPYGWKFTKAPAGVKVFFTMRHGGVSEPPYESLNLGFHVGDDHEHVIQNRRALSEALGIAPAGITSPRQRHTSRVMLLEHDEQVGAGAYGEESFFDPCDGLATALPAAPILLQFADCLPVALMAGGPRLAACVLHAGRRGIVDGVVRNGVAMMTDQFGVRPVAITAALGPAIGPCCYEVGSGIAREFEARFGPEAVAGANVDLAAAAIIDLKSAGIPPENIHLLDACTCCNHELLFLSPRRRDRPPRRHRLDRKTRWRMIQIRDTDFGKLHDQLFRNAKTRNSWKLKTRNHTDEKTSISLATEASLPGR